MKSSNRILFIALSALASISTSSAVADVTSIKLAFGGGCFKSNTTGSCTLKPRFSGFDLNTETAVLYLCAKPTSGCTILSPRRHSVSEAGEVSMRIKNVPGGCFQVRTGPNGNDKPDVKSQILCEK